MTAAIWWPAFWACVAVLLGVLGALIAALFRSRKGRGHEEPLGSRLFLPASEGVAAASAIGLLMLITGEGPPRAMRSPAEGNPIRIELTEHPGWWEVRYPGASGSSGIVAANEIHFPLGRSLALRLEPEAAPRRAESMDHPLGAPLRLVPESAVSFRAWLAGQAPSGGPVVVARRNSPPDPVRRPSSNAPPTLADSRSIPAEAPVRAASEPGQGAGPASRRN